MYISNQNSTYGLMLDIEASSTIGLGIQGSGYKPYGYTLLSYAFEAMIP